MRIGWLALAVSGVIVAACSGDDEAAIPNPAEAADAGNDAGNLQDSAADSGTSSGDDDDASSPVDAGVDAALPITAPDDAWSWVDFPESKCGSGSATGIGVNPHAGATELLIYFQGGGSCTTGETCWGAQPKATFMAGFGASDFATIAQKNYPILNRSIAANPMSAMNMVYIPYCTGDLHGGYGEADLTLPDGGTQPTYFYGGFDMDLFLARLLPTFPAMKRVVLAGTSAGGFGTFLNFDRVAKAFGVRVDVIDDSGPPIPPAVAKSIDASPWKLGKPAACPNCQSLRDIYDADRAAQPSSRFGLLTFDRDSTIAPDFGYTVDQYPGVIATFTSSIATDKNAAVFEVDLPDSGADHVVESKLTYATSYLPWMTKLLNDDPTWTGETITGQ